MEVKDFVRVFAWDKPWLLMGLAGVCLTYERIRSGSGAALLRCRSNEYRRSIERVSQECEPIPGQSPVHFRRNQGQTQAHYGWMEEA
ncbi:MAG: hypothetical protein K2L23_02060 [Odoribacter sp.]|nr:hypothetical protein [Odoribacter sp.]